jgi:Uma2 family endonuclease
MAGASEAHNLIVVNLLSHLSNRLRADCRAYSSDMRLLVSATGLYNYPGVIVVCGNSILASQQGDVLTNPCLIVEVLSDATKKYDRDDKFYQYRHIPSVREYVMVSQAEIQAEQSGEDATLSLPSAGIELKLIDIQDKVDIKR